MLRRLLVGEKRCVTSQKRLRGGGNLLSRRRLLGSLSNDDGDVIENGKKAKGLDWQNNNFARASRFSLPSLHDYDVKMLIVRSLSAKYRPDRYRRDKSVKFGTELP